MILELTDLFVKVAAYYIGVCECVFVLVCVHLISSKKKYLNYIVCDRAYIWMKT